LFVKMLGVSFAVIAAVLLAVSLPLTWQARERLARTMVENLEQSQLRIVDDSKRRQRAQGLSAQALAENPTLKAAVDTYQVERRHGGDHSQLTKTIQRELAKLQKRLETPMLAFVDVSGTILASAGARSGDWVSGDRIGLRSAGSGEPTETVVLRGDQAYVATAFPLALGNDVIGDVILASPLDDAYALQIAMEAGTEIAILIEGRVVASSVARSLRQAIDRVGMPIQGEVTLDGETFLVRRLQNAGNAAVYALGSVSAALRTATTDMASVLLAIGFGALLLAAIASWWLASTLASPIHDLTRTLADMARNRDFDRPLPPSGVSQELDALAETFDALRNAVTMAEAESEATYLGVIGALAAALDARDPYTAGHSERVANLSVAIGRQMHLTEKDVETLRLGGLLHDIGKIGVSDSVLRKPGTLTADEFEQIKRHPGLGARILKPLRFLADHLAIVELHHEQPDGRGYPHGLKGDQIPLLASIVRVADAFDAITTARAYRPARSATDAMAEIWRFAGTGFNMQVVQAFAAMPEATVVPAHTPSDDPTAVVAAAVSGALVPFRLRTGNARESAG
jgi:putative nucleotidyltransferase with HDIG domain